jgi:phosphoserine phosphatase
MAQLGLDHSLCNRFEVDGRGLHTGRPLGALCYGHGKVAHAEAYARERGVALESCAFYTDSYTDLPVLERVGRPVAVHPDPRLARVAKRRGWRVEDWSAPQPQAL